MPANERVEILQERGVARAAREIQIADHLLEETLVARIRLYDEAAHPNDATVPGADTFGREAHDKLMRILASGPLARRLRSAPAEACFAPPPTWFQCKGWPGGRSSGWIWPLDAPDFSAGYNKRGLQDAGMWGTLGCTSRVSYVSNCGTMMSTFVQLSLVATRHGCVVACVVLLVGVAASGQRAAFERLDLAGAGGERRLETGLVRAGRSRSVSLAASSIGFSPAISC